MPINQRAQILACVLAIVLIVVSTDPQAQAANQSEFREDLRQLCASPTRVVGSDGYYRAGEYIERQIRLLPNVEIQRQEFQIVVPMTHGATLKRNHGASAEPIYPFWPAHTRLNATPIEGITGNCVYIGDARFDQIIPAKLAGQIAVCRASAGEKWVNAFYFGAKALLVLGDDEATNVDLRSHELAAPVDLPRFYIPPGTLNDDLRAGRITAPVAISAAANWESKTAINYFALVKSAQATGPALLITVPYDSSGLVPDLAAGASQAAQVACAFAILRRYSENPPNRPILFCFTGGDAIAQQATRQMFLALGDVPAQWASAIAEEREKLDIAKRAANLLEEISTDPTQLDIRQDRQAIDRIATLIETDAALEQDDLFRLRRDTPTDASIPQLENHQVLLNRLRYSFLQHPADLQNDLAEPARLYIRRTLEKLRGQRGLINQYSARLKQLEDRVALYQWLASKIGRDTNPSPRANNSRVLELLIALDLSDHGTRCGPMFVGKFQSTSNIAQIQDYRDWFARTDRAYEDGDATAKWWGGARHIISLDPLNGAHSPTTWLSAPLALGSELCQAWGVPGFSMITLDDLRLRRDTPTDTIEHLNVDAILPQLDAAQQTIAHAWSDPTFKGPTDLPWQRTQLMGQVVSPAPGKPIPDLPREGFLIAYHHTEDNLQHIPKPMALPWVLGTRRTEIQETDAEGNWQIEALPRLGDQQMLAIEAYRCEPKTGAIKAISDLGKQLGDITPCADLRNDNPRMRNIVFTADAFSLVGLYDPRYLQNLDEVTPLDARRNADPQRYNAILANRMLAGFVEPGARTDLLFRFGRVGNRLILINAPGATNSSPSPSGRGQGEGVPDLPKGFTIQQLSEINPIAVATATDVLSLDAMRITQYRQAGVSSPLIDQLQSTAAEQLNAAKSAQTTRQPAAEVMNAATAAWSANARVYAAAQDLANDVVRGAIFLLLLCVPFSFCMERLLIAATNINHRIAAAACIFALMTAALWSFHPAFAISASPLIIVLAFAILFMSAMVMFVIYNRFDAELKKIRSAGASTDAVSFARAAVLGSAILLGIANLRRRRFRTALTSITIVLITFALLCFTGATRYLDTTTLPTGIATSYPGIQIRQRGLRPLPELLLENLEPLLPNKTIVEHWWNTNPGDPREMINVTSQNRTFAATAAVGLSPGESKLSKIAEIIGQKQFARLENGERDIIYVSQEVANQLQVKQGDQVTVGGLRLQLAGTYNAKEFDQKVRTLSGEPLSPLKYETALLDASGRSLSDVAAESLDLDTTAGGGELSATYEHLSSNQFFIVPAAISKLLPNATLRSLAVRIDDAEKSEDRGWKIEDSKVESASSLSSTLYFLSPLRSGASPDAEISHLTADLARRFSIALYAGYPDGVRLVSATNLAKANGAGQIAIPLAIAALIIFNTMLGSIAERRREIHIYTSLGFAPLHVGALFVAEACVYGLIGTVFGYIIGQAVGTTLLKLGWLGHITLNYSGTAAMLTMSLILIIVIAAALIPARIASQIASPSIERNWKLPAPIDDTITADLPFTINKKAAESVIANVADFFAAHTEGSVGKFVADQIATTTAADQAHSVRAIIWLTPFDLGIRQQCDLRITPGDFPDIYQVQVTLKRLSGDTNSWQRTNRTFVAELRKQFLQSCSQ